MKIIIIALSPVLAFLFFIYQKDRFDREPPSILLKNYVLGMLIVIPVIIVERTLMGSNLSVYPFYQAFIVAGLTEELFKLIVVLSVSYNSPYYNEKLDGIVYAVFASLGFASVENILYVLSSPNYLTVGITRGLLAIPAHMLFAINMGYYLSLSKFSTHRSLKSYYISLSFIVSVILHGIYDYILISKIYGFMPIFILFIIILWRYNLIRLDKYIEESRKNNK